MCNYKFNHKDLVIPDKWTREEIDIILETILYDKYEVLNDLILVLKNKSLEDIVILLSNYIIIGQKEQKIAVNCNYCGKIIKIPKYLYLKHKEQY